MFVCRRSILSHIVRRITPIKTGLFIRSAALLDTSSSLRDYHATNAVNVTHRQDTRLKQTVFKQRSDDILTNVKYRRAVLDDLPDVLRIRRDYEFDNGIDRLRDRWGIIMSDEKYYPAVGIIDGDIVAFSYQYVMDAGRALVNGASRCTPGLPGWEVIHKLQSFNLDSVKVVHPVTSEMSVVSENDYYLTNPHRYKVIEKRGYRCYMTSTEELTSLRWNADYPVHDVTSLQPHLMPDIITNTVNKHLFPSGRFCVDYHPFSVMKENVEIIQNQWKVFVTLHPNMSGKCQAVSFLSHYDGDNARCINAEIYTDNISGSAVIQHIVKAVEYFLNMDNYSGRIILELQFHPDLSESVDHFTSLKGFMHSHYANNCLVVKKVK